MSLQTRIEDFGQQHMAFVSLFEPDGSRRFVCRPFKNGHVDQTLIAGGFLWCSGPVRGSMDIQLAKIDLETGAVLGTVTAELSIGKLFYAPAVNKVIVLSIYKIGGFNADTLRADWVVQPCFRLHETRGLLRRSLDYNVQDDSDYHTRENDDLVLTQGTLATGPDGMVRVPMGVRGHNKWERRVDATGMLVLDPTDGTFTLDLLEQFPMPAGYCVAMEALSPNGRYGVRSAIRTDYTRLAGLDTDENIYFKRVNYVEIWDIVAAKLLHVIPCLPILLPLSTRYGAKDAHIFSNYTGFSGAAQKLTGTVSRTYPKAPTAYPAREPHHSPRILGTSDYDRVRLIWEAGGEAFWIYRRSSLRRVTVDGGGGPTVLPAHFMTDAQRAVAAERMPDFDLEAGGIYPFKHIGYFRSIVRQGDQITLRSSDGDFVVPVNYTAADFDAPAPADVMPPLPKLTAKDIAATLKALIPCAGWKPEQVTASLNDLTTRLNAGIEELASGDGLDVYFKVRAAFLDEWAFFDKLTDKNVDVAAPVHALMTAWIAALETSSRRFAATDDDRLAGPMTAPLEYLVRSDTACGDILRRFLILRDGEHEGYSKRTILVNHIESRAAGTPQAIALAVFYVFINNFDGSFWVNEGKVDHGWNAFDAISKARDTLTPEAFLQIITTEHAYFKAERTTLSQPIGGLLELLVAATPWDATLIPLLEDLLKFMEKQEA